MCPYPLFCVRIPFLACPMFEFIIFRYCPVCPGVITLRKNKGTYANEEEFG